MKNIRTLVAAIAAALATSYALADVTIGVSISLTGPTSALGVPTRNGIELWPKAIAGEKLDAILAALDGGMSKAAVCRNFGVKRTTLIETLARVGWPAAKAAMEK